MTIIFPFFPDELFFRARICSAQAVEETYGVQLLSSYSGYVDLFVERHDEGYFLTKGIVFCFLFFLGRGVWSVSYGREKVNGSRNITGE